MRLRLALSPNTEPVPFDHLHRLTGALHKWLGENDAHDGLSLYSFGWLSGGRARSGHVQFEGGAGWTLSFCDPALAKRALGGLVAEPSVLCGMEVLEAQVVPEPALDPEHRFLTASPVLTRRTRDDGGRDHLRWDDSAADDTLTRTFHTKLQAAGLPTDGASVGFDRSFGGAKTKLCRFKGNAYRANACPVVATGSPDQLRLLWLAGAGEMTGSGFGALR
ncbi:CRISPR-associated endoribonuclease Cas6 [Rubrivirga sp. S365]|uniref:CRISPR-associated endoribonuclease Cas6 n=1 Tax=Rubrivirga sp. S365 TaxID=3076080 RepID=UPI0028C975D6|nr:CRISPR-associated endoribonuclease Cas6 [Rubrivirga sp. S365]MDT7858122.1 CRISPR-associated endoribonuclease Cas6 [Rubrivirga sp. S365]